MPVDHLGIFAVSSRDMKTAWGSNETLFLELLKIEPRLAWCSDNCKMDFVAKIQRALGFETQIDNSATGDLNL